MGRRTKNLIHCAGIQSPGLTTAPAVAMDVAAMAVKALSSQKEIKPNTGFRPNRKGIPRLRELPEEERDRLIRENPDYGVIICRCEEISKGEILDALNSPLPVCTVDGIKTVSYTHLDVYKRQFDVLPKKEVIQIKKEWEKLEKNLGGIKNMTRIPDAIFVVDPKKERICVQEAHILGITLIGIGDTNCDPEELDFIIPGNDDAIRAVKLITSKMADAVIEANQGEAVYDEAALATEATDIEEVAVEAETAAE